MIGMLAVAPAFAAATPWTGDAHASARLITAVQAAGSADQIDAGLQIRLAPGWHAYWRDPGEAGIPPSVDWSGSRNVRAAKMFWPTPQRAMLDGLVTQGYQRGVVLPIAVSLEHAGKPVLLHALVHYSACKTLCVSYTALLTLSLPAGIAAPGPQSPLIARAWQTVPTDLPQAGLAVSHVVISQARDGNSGSVLSLTVDGGETPLHHLDVFVEGIPGSTPGAPKIWPDPARNRTVLTVPLEKDSPKTISGKSLRFTLENGQQAATFSATPMFGPLPRQPAVPFDFRIFLIALLGGLILNVMPCVLPVLSLKLLSFAAANGMERRQFRLNLLATASGVLASFMLIALALILLKQAGAAIGWGIQFQSPWFLGIMAVLTTLFAASLWEWLPIPMPGFGRQAARVGAGGHPRIAAFTTGAFATLLATSCSAPFIGTAVGFALARDPVAIAGIFAALGLGMALPYLAVAAMPGLARWMPKPGVWMVWVRIILGFALFGTAIWLVSIIGDVVSAGAAGAALVGLLALLALLFWRSRIRQDRQTLRYMVGILLVGSAAFAVVSPPLISPARIAASSEGDTTWQAFDQARIGALVAQRRLVFVDVTAAWCLICKVNALTVLERNPAATRLRAPDVVAMRANWTRPSARITAYLQSFGRYGVPLDVVYGPRAPSGIVLPSVLTPGVVMQALRRAGALPATKEAAR